MAKAKASRGKGFIRFLIVLAAIILILTILGPHLILALAKQPTPEDSYSYSDSFYTSYDAIREHIGERIEMLRQVVEDTADELKSEKVVEAMKKAVPTFIDPNEVNKKAEQSDEMKEVK